VSEASGILTRRLGPPLLLALGVAGLVLGGVAGAQLRRATPFGPPLVSPSGLAVDREGRVYAGTDVDRIHVYDIDGRFLRGWYLDSEAGPVRLRIDAADHIEVATARSGRLHVFDRDGQLVRTQPDSAAFQRFGATQERVADRADAAPGAGAGRLPPAHVVRRRAAAGVDGAPHEQRDRAARGTRAVAGPARAGPRAVAPGRALTGPGSFTSALPRTPIATSFRKNPG
jgi:hypothetical protein